jgi:hypothetical protein
MDYGPSTVDCPQQYNPRMVQAVRGFLLCVRCEKPCGLCGKKAPIP